MASGATIVLLARLPEAGRVRTRLHARYSPEQSEAIHRIFLRHTARRIDGLERGPLTVCYAPHTAQDGFERMLGDLASRYLAQVDGDLGERIAEAHRELSPHYGRVLFIGADAPDVPAAMIHHALEALLQFPVVLGPTDDGAFWCLGLQSSVDVVQLLEQVKWNAGHECEAILNAADRMGIEDCVLGRWSDVDHPSELDGLLWRLEHSSDSEDQRLLRELARVLPVIDVRPSIPALVES